MNKFFIFSDVYFDKDIFGFNILHSYKFILNEYRYKRIFFANKHNDLQDCFVYVINLESDHFISAVEYNSLHSDCNKNIFDLINSHQELFGFSSVSKNILIGSIFDLKNYDEKIGLCLKGEKGWNSLKEFFECINESNVKYVTLRKNEWLPYKFIDDDKDLDLLCDNLNEFVLAFGLSKRSIGISGYKILINGEFLPVDVRFKGDEYICSIWAQYILDNRILNNNNIYVIDSTNYIYSILFHVLTQKKTISMYYLSLINKYFPNAQNDYLITILGLYMKRNGFKYSKPIDISVYQNKTNIRKLNSIVRPKMKSNFIRNFFIRLPSVFFLKRIRRKIMIKDEDCL